MFGRYRNLTGSDLTFSGQLMSKLRSMFSGENATPEVSVSEPYQPLPEVEYPQETYEPPLDAPGYEMQESVEEQASMDMATDAVEQVHDSAEMFPEPRRFQKEMDDSVLLSHAREIDKAIDEAGGNLDEDSFTELLEEAGFFDDAVMDGPGGIDDVLEDPFGGQEQPGSLESLMDEPMLEDSMMDG